MNGQQVGYDCTECEFKLWLPIARLRRSVLGLYDDNRFPGRVILVLDRHAEHLHELDPDVACDFLEDARQAARAIASATRSPRINYAVLGNTHAHLHWHVIPRQPDLEPLPDRPPWEDPRRSAPLDPDRLSDLMGAIASSLGRHVG